MTAEFGAPGAGLSGKRGQYLLWVYMTAWRIETAVEVIGGSGWSITPGNSA